MVVEEGGVYVQKGKTKEEKEENGEGDTRKVKEQERRRSAHNVIITG